MDVLVSWEDYKKGLIVAIPISNLGTHITVNHGNRMISIDLHGAPALLSPSKPGKYAQKFQKNKLIIEWGPESLAKRIGSEIAALGYNVYYAEAFSITIEKRDLAEDNVVAIVYNSGGYIHVYKYPNGAHVEAYVDELSMWHPDYSWKLNDSYTRFVVNGTEEIVPGEPYFGAVLKPGDPPVNPDEFGVDEDTITDGSYTISEALNLHNILGGKVIYTAGM